MIGLTALWNRLQTRHKSRRKVRNADLKYDRYGIDLLEKRQMLAVAPASDFNYTASNGQVAITSYLGSAATLEIPALIDGLPVRSIGEAAFSNHTILTSVTIPASVTTIANVPFQGCTGLTAITVSGDNTAYSSHDGMLYTKDAATLVACPAGRSGVFTIPSDVTSIGLGAFQGCVSLTAVTMPSGLRNIGYKAFDGCQSLTSITIPSGVTTIRDGAFNACSLTTVSIPASVTSIGDNPFAGCILLNTIAVSPDNTAYASQDGVLYTKNGTILLACPGGRSGGFAIPAGVTSVAAMAFQDCSRLTSVTIPDTVTYLGYDAFWNCSGLTRIAIPDSVSSTNNGVFGLCESLRSVRLSRSLTELSGWLFLDCQALTDITIPDGVTVVNAGAFKDCHSLTSIVIPAGVTSIGWEAFKRCTSLTAVKMQSSPPTLGPEVFDGVNPNQAIVYYPAGTNGWTDTFGDLPTRPYGVPGAPPSIVGVRGDGSVQLSWTTPVSDGLSVKDYAIQYSTDGASWQTFTHAASVATTATVTGLTNGTGYLFRVASVSDFGPGLYSANSSVVTPATTPGTPTAVVGIRGSGQVQLSWSSPESNGGSAVTDYTIQYSSTSGSSWQTFTHAASAATTATVTRLTNGTRYVFRVASVNAVGTGSYSANSSAATPATTPGTPNAVVGIRGDGQVQLFWTAPVSNGGSAVKDYTIQYSTDGSSWQTFSHAASVAATATVTGLTNGTGYVFKVAGVNDAGTGLYSATSSAVTPATTPGTPNAVGGIRGKGQVQLSWTAPVSDGGSAVTDYTIQYSTDGASWQTFGHAASTATTATVTGLSNGAGYLFRVAGVNDLGTGVYAVTASRIVPSLVPFPPSNVVATRGNGVVRLSWTAPVAAGGIPVGDYTVQYSTNGGLSWVTARDGSSPRASAVISGLVIGRDSIFRVASVGRYGAGDFSAPSEVVRPATVPTAPLRLVATAGAGQVMLSWNPPASNGSSAITQYIIQYAPSRGRWVMGTTVGATTTTATLSGLLAARP